MQGTRIESLAQTVRNFIALPALNGSVVGIVHFETDAMTKAFITLLETEDDRNYLLDAVPIDADGGTSIGDGLELCHHVS